ncbi:surface antigen [Plasmodium falciparum UGT5.1]|uniref:Surface antigen n=1 Tax=Plasmodium falciparum UGT5.1 TaxID=1237627 RepID=W7JJ60_PLAFA|nr:surface antigen [Plasmodium falciparum UGT5.1]
MKMHYSEILFFSLSINILITSSYAHNKYKPYIIRHTGTTTSRLLSECDLNTPNCDNDPDMKSVKENFDRQTSRRFEEYNERMNKNRQKCKEQCDKDIKKIIVKDKMEKSLAEKVEKVCLKCGCGLRGVAVSVGIIGPAAVKGLENAALLAASQTGIDVGIKAAIDGLGKIVALSEFNLIKWNAMVTPTTYNKPMDLVRIVSKAYYACEESTVAEKTRFCLATKAWDTQYNMSGLQIISTQAADVAAKAGKAAKAAEEAGMTLANAKSSYLYSSIGYSVLSILIIVLVMIIIYLILRYRRTKKINKKLQYTKLLNQ